MLVTHQALSFRTTAENIYCNEWNQYYYYVSKCSLRHWQCNLCAFNRFDIHNCQWRLITEDVRWLGGAFFTQTAIGGTNSQKNCTVYTNIYVVRLIKSNKHHDKLIKFIKVNLWINWFSYFKWLLPQNLPLIALLKNSISFYKMKLSISVTLSNISNYLQNV